MHRGRMKREKKKKKEGSQQKVFTI